MGLLWNGCSCDMISFLKVGFGKPKWLPPLPFLNLGLQWAGEAGWESAAFDPESVWAYWWSENKRDWPSEGSQGKMGLALPGLTKQQKKTQSKNVTAINSGLPASFSHLITHSVGIQSIFPKKVLHWALKMGWEGLDEELIWKGVEVWLWTCMWPIPV